jgi:hypothetical protein
MKSKRSRLRWMLGSERDGQARFFRRSKLGASLPVITLYARERPIFSSMFWACELRPEVRFAIGD